MLLNYAQFLIRQGTRSAMHLTNPRLIASDQVALPRDSVIHYLNYTEDNHFPPRSLNYLSNVNLNKRIPVTNVVTLDETTDTTMIGNRTLEKQLRAWRKDNTQHFKLVDLFVVPNTDVQTHAVINYQNLKDLYRYKSNAVAELSRYNNVYKTYWANVHKALLVSPNAEHFTRIDIPSLLPSKSLLDNLLKFPDTTYARVVRDPALNSVIQLYRYLNTETRNKSCMSSLTEQDCEHVTVELVYQGYSCFFRLSFLVALSEQSTLESKRKLNISQLQRLYLMIILKVQNKVYELQNALEPQAQEYTYTELDTLDEEDDSVVPTNVKQSLQEAGSSSFTKQGASYKAADKELPITDDDFFSIALNDNLQEFEGQADDVFTRLIADTVGKVSTGPIKASVGDSEPSERDTGNSDETVDAQSEEVTLTADYSPERSLAITTTKSLVEGFEEYLNNAKLSGAVSTAELRSLKKLFDQRKLMKSPYSQDSIDTAKVVTKEDVSIPADELKINAANNLVDEDLKTETLFNFDRMYLEKLLKKDVLGCVTQIEDAGIIIKDYQVEQNNSALGSYEVHKLTLKPYKGKESTVYFRLPVVNKEGEFTASGIRYRMRKTRQPNPLVKMSPTRVGITSNYGKLFIDRTERKSYDPYSQVTDYIKNDYLGSQDVIVSITPGNCFDNHAVKPNMFMAMSQSFRYFTTKDKTFIFDPKDATDAVKKEVIEQIEASKEFFFVGFNNADKTLLVMDMNDEVFNHSDLTTSLGGLPSLLSMDTSKIVTPFATIKVLGDTLALGPVLAYYTGLKGLIEVSNTKVQVVGARKQVPSTKDTVVLKLLDCKVVLTTDTPVKKLLFGGFAFYKETLKTLTLESMQSKGVYLSLFEQRGSSLMHLRELDLLSQLFLDPITKDVLRSMQEPDMYLPVLLRACDMLGDFKHPDINDPEHSRIRGYDRIPGLMYRTLAQSVRATKLGMSKGKVELDPYGVWNAITQDTTVKIVEDSNPITDVKETEALTFTGADGLSKGATPEKMRRYHKNDIGLVSEATVDSSDVALNIYLTPYAKLENLRGKVAKTKQTRQDTVFSTSVLLTPMGEMDDPKRVNFVSIQNGHTIAADGYTQPMLRTGYEYLMPYKVGALYCITSKKEGKVVSINDKQLKVTYADGNSETIRLGETYGRMEGSVYKHKIVSDLKEGQKFAKGEYLSYNSGFFERDWIDPKRLIMKFNRTVTVALSMGDEVYEDSSAISKKLGESMATDTVKEKAFVIEFDKNIVGMKSEGDLIDVNDSLFTLTDNLTDYSNLSQSSIDLLKSIANLSPKAKMKGNVFRYEVKYNGDLSDMSPTLKKLVTRLDQQTQLESESGDVVIKNNRVTGEYRCEGKNLMPRTLELKIFIQHKTSQSHGDKGVFAAQMKSVISEVFRSTVTTASGVEIDAMFSYKSILNRVALSPLLAGTTNRLLKHISPMVADAYFN